MTGYPVRRRYSYAHLSLICVTFEESERYHEEGLPPRAGVLAHGSRRNG